MNQRIIIVGDGRMGGALGRALRGAGYSVSMIDRHHGLGRCRLAGKALVVFFCVPDGEIAKVDAQYAYYLSVGQVVAHCAGAMDLTVLKQAAKRGAHVGSMHPLCAVPSPTASLCGAFAAIDGDRAAVRILRQIASQVGMNPFRLRGEDRALYHAAAAMASNGLVALAQQSVELFTKCGLSRARALDAIVPLMQSAYQGLERNGLPRALTGPIARGDGTVIAAHLEALQKCSTPNALAVYHALSLALLPVARRLKGAKTANLDQIERMLRR